MRCGLPDGAALLPAPAAGRASCGSFPPAAVLLSGVLLASGCTAGPEPGVAPASARVEPLVWTASVAGDVSTGGGGGGSPTVGLDDPLGLEAGALVRAEVERGPWTLLAGGLHVDYGGSTRDLGGLSTDVGIEATIAELALARRVAAWRDAGERAARIDVLAGLRYANVELTLDSQGAGSFGDGEEWVDPFVGGRVRASWRERLGVEVGGDVGGFGLASDLVWSAAARFDWTPTPGFGVFFGYEVLDYDFDESADSGTFRYDVRLHGPFVGVSLRF